MTDAAKANLRRLIREEGAPAAYQALVRVLNDPRASSTALSSAARTMMDLAGLMREQDAPPKQPHEMSAEELQAAVERVMESRPQDDPESSVFE